MRLIDPANRNTPKATWSTAANGTDARPNAKLRYAERALVDRIRSHRYRADEVPYISDRK
jgi:hypothetical protein